MAYNKRQSFWNQKLFKLLSFTYPEKMEHAYYKNRMYRVTIKYSNKDDKEKYKTIYFGVKGHKYGIDGKKESIKKTKYHEDYFHPRFWEMMLLNRGSSISENFIALADSLLK